MDVKVERLGIYVRAERPGILSRLERKLPSQDAEDIYQDACVRALDRLQQQTGKGTLRAWFNAVLRSTLATHSKEQAGRQAIAEVGLQQAPGDRAETCGCGLATLGRLRPSHQSVLRMAILGGWSTDESAASEGITPNNFRVRLHRARAALRNSWAVFCGACITVDGGSNCACAEQGDGETQ